MSACAYVSWRRNSYCCDVFRFEVYAAGVCGRLASLNITRLRPLLLSCCAKVDVVGMCVVRVLLSVMQISVGILVLGWYAHVSVSPP
jgi:hypothetical protein